MERKETYTVELPADLVETMREFIPKEHQDRHDTIESLAIWAILSGINWARFETAVKNGKGLEVHPAGEETREEPKPLLNFYRGRG
jgi:hypothetical protein